MCRTARGASIAWEGKLKGKPHHRAERGSKDEVPCVVLDYMYMRGDREDEEEKSAKEEEDGKRKKFEADKSKSYAKLCNLRV